MRRQSVVAFVAASALHPHMGKNKRYRRETSCFENKKNGRSSSKLVHALHLLYANSVYRYIYKYGISKLISFTRITVETKHKYNHFRIRQLPYAPHKAAVAMCTPPPLLL